MKTMRNWFIPALFCSCLLAGCSADPGVIINGKDVSRKQTMLLPPATRSVTNDNGIAGVYVSNSTTTITTNTNFIPIAMIQVRINDAITSLQVSDGGTLADIKDPYRLELEKSFIEFKSNRICDSILTKGPDNNNDTEILQDLIQDNIELTIANKEYISNVSQEDIAQALETASKQYADVLLSNQITAMNQAASNNSRDLSDYMALLTNSDQSAKSLLGSNLRNKLKTALNESIEQQAQNEEMGKQIPESKTIDDHTFEKYFINSAVSGDICVYMDDILDGGTMFDPLIGGHSFIWNANIKKLLSSGLVKDTDGRNGCRYFYVNENDGYLLHDHMWHKRVNYPINISAFEAQMNGFESRNHLNGYLIQNLDRRITEGGTYCNQVVWMNWWEYTGGCGNEKLTSVMSTSPLEMNSGRGLNIGMPRSWIWILQIRACYVTCWVQVMWWGFWMTVPYLEYYWVQSPQSDLVVGTDILGNTVNQTIQYYHKMLPVH